MKVLIAVDEKACVAQVAAFVRQHKWPDESEFFLLHVIAPVMIDYPMASYPLFLESLSAEVQKAADELVKGAKSVLDGELAGRLQSDVRVGYPVQVVTEFAREWKADLVIVGSHGRHGLERFLLGSVSQEIAAQVPCSVVILRLVRNEAEAQVPAAKAVSTTSST